MDLKVMQVLWPSVADVGAATKAAKQGVVAATFIVGATVVSLVFGFSRAGTGSVTDIYASVLGDILPMAVLGVFVWRMSRIAAVLALAMAVVEMLYKFNLHNTVGVMPMMILLFINSVRGTFAFHRLRGGRAKADDGRH